VVHYILLIVVTAFVFDFINGFHDSANSIATIVGTRVLSPFAAVVWAAFFNFVAAFTVGTAVAKAIGAGMIDLSIVTPNVIMGGLLGAIIWNLITWFYGIPSSSSHALIGGYAGAAVAAAGLGGIVWGPKWVQTLSFIVLSPLVGMIAGFLLMLSVFWIFRNASARKVDRFFRPGQLFSSALLSWSHGGNDAQKTMGVLTLALASYYGWSGSEWSVPLWVILSAATAMGLGTAVGGWRIVRTMGLKVVELRPIDGFAAETAAGTVIEIASRLGIPVSTTHVISSAILGVGATRRASAVRWGIAGRIVTAWVVTIPICVIFGWSIYEVLHFITGAD
jgi:inorganic phosphate transporter, PiT family